MITLNNLLIYFWDSTPGSQWKGADFKKTVTNHKGPDS
jgi:hypothetical protein